MSSRQVKKLKEKLQKEQKDKIKDENQDQEDQEQFQESKQHKQFFNVFQNDDDDEEENQENNQQIEDIQNNEKQQENAQEEKKSDINQKQQQKKDKKKKKKQKIEEQKQQDEELDKYLDQIKQENQKQLYKQVQQQNQEQGSNLNQDQQEEERKIDLSLFQVKTQIGKVEINSPLEIFVSKLNYNKELQKYFKNAKLVEETKNYEEEQMAMLGMKDKRLAKRLKQRQPNLLKNYKLVYGLKGGFTMPEKFACNYLRTNKFGQQEYAFFPTQRYEQLQEIYLQTKNSFDPQQMFDFISQNPFHADGLYDIGEFFRLQGNFKESNGILEQILFVYESCLSADFKQIFSDNENRYCLSFHENVYSRSFFFGLLKFTDILGKKGCYRAALEYSKFLLKLNPVDDPVGALLYLDYNALSSKQYDYLIYFTANFAKNLYKNTQNSILYMPNYIYSYAMAKFLSKKEQMLNEYKVFEIGEFLTFTKQDFESAISFDKDKNHLDENENVLILVAILLYPSLIKDIAEKNEFQKQPNMSHSSFTNWQKKSFKEIFLNQFFVNSETQKNNVYYSFLQLQNENDLEGLQKIFEIYVERSKIIYKNNQVILWIKAAIGFLLNTFETYNSEQQQKQGESQQNQEQEEVKSSSQQPQNAFQYDEFIENLASADLKKNILPFSLGRYKKLNKGDFSDHIERLDLNNIQDNEAANMNNAFQQAQNVPQNPLNTNQSLISQFFQSILPWVNLPVDNNNNQQQQQQQQVIFQDEDVVIKSSDDEENYEDYAEEN